MTVARDQDTGHCSTVASSDAIRDKPMVHSEMSADLQHDATVLTLVGHTAHRKMVAGEVWS